jgi:hypothetical protein
MLQDPSSLDGVADAIAQRILQQLGSGVPMPDLDEPQLPSLPRRDDLGGLRLHASLAIAGVELTQSIQYSSAAGGGYGPDNSVPLVALKQLVARVYPAVRAGLIGDQLSGSRVSGELTVSVGDRVLYRTGPTRAIGARVGPQRSLDSTLWDQELTFPVSSGGSGLSEQVRWETLNASLNFVVPAYYCRRGGAVVSVRIWVLLPGGSRGTGTDWWQRVTFLDVAAPRICVVRVNWTNSAGTTFTPSDADMLGSMSLAERILPFPYFETKILPTAQTSSAAFAVGASSPGACNAAWDRLVAELGVLGIFTALFGLGDIVVGFVPSAAIPPGSTNIVIGCGRGGAGFFVGQDIALAHELGHLYQRPHVAVPGDPSNDTSYPNYGGSNRSIGEVGIDTGTEPPTLFDPTVTVDLMAYPVKSEQQWISPYTYQKILDARGLHQSAPANPARVRTRLVLGVRLERTGVVKVRRALRVDAAGDVARQWEGATSPLSVDVLDANGAPLLTHHLLYVAPRGSGCGCGCGAGCGGGGPVPAGREPWLDMDEVLEWPDGAASLAFHTGGEPVHTVTVGEAPRLEVSRPERADGAIRLRWSVRHRRETPSIAVLFTGDDGQTWWPIAIDPPESELEVAEDGLPAGGSSRFRIIASAELQSAVVDTEIVDLAPAPRRIHIIAPDDTCGLAAGPVRLTAVLDLRGHAPLQAHDLQWRSDIDGDLGVGAAITAHLSAGTHQVTVSGPDGIGGTLQEVAIIIVGG